MGSFERIPISTVNSYSAAVQFRIQDFSFTSPGYLNGESFNMGVGGFDRFILLLKTTALEGSNPGYTFQLLNVPQGWDPNDPLVEPMILSEMDIYSVGSSDPVVGDLFLPNMKIYVGFDTNETTLVTFNAIIYVTTGGLK